MLLDHSSGMKKTDEPMAPQIIHACKSGIISNMITGVPLDLSRLKFGAIHFVEKYSNSMAKFTSMGLSSNIILEVQHSRERKL